jgi:hypothetical protein
MADVYLTLNVISDVVALFILVLIVKKLAFSDKEHIKSQIARHYESMRRDKIFRKSLLILAVSLAFSVASAVMAVFYLNRNIINTLQFLSALFRILFFLYLLSVIKKV